MVAVAVLCCPCALGGWVVCGMDFDSNSGFKHTTTTKNGMGHATGVCIKNWRNSPILEYITYMRSILLLE